MGRDSDDVHAEMRSATGKINITPAFICTKRCTELVKETLFKAKTNLFTHVINGLVTSRRHSTLSALSIKMRFDYRGCHGAAVHGGCLQVIVIASMLIRLTATLKCIWIDYKWDQLMKFYF